MNTADIIKAREGLETFLAIAMQQFGPNTVSLARESLAAFERLVAEPTPAAPQIPPRSYIATHVAASLVSCNQRKTGEVADEAVRVADALIERLNRP